MYFLRGSLPWEMIDLEDTDAEREAIVEQKKTISAQELCNDLPPVFVRYIEYIRSLRPGDKPRYAMLREWFRSEFRKAYEYDAVYDWTVVKFQLLQAEEAEKRELEVSAKELHTRKLRSGHQLSHKVKHSQTRCDKT